MMLAKALIMHWFDINTFNYTRKNDIHTLMCYKKKHFLHREKKSMKEYLCIKPDTKEQEWFS